MTAAVPIIIAKAVNIDLTTLDLIDDKAVIIDSFTTEVTVFQVFALSLPLKKYLSSWGSISSFTLTLSG